MTPILLALSTYFIFKESGKFNGIEFNWWSNKGYAKRRFNPHSRTGFANKIKATDKE